MLHSLENILKLSNEAINLYCDFSMSNEPSPLDEQAAASSAGTLTSGMRAVELDQIEEGEACGTRLGPSGAGSRKRKAEGVIGRKRLANLQEGQGDQQEVP